MDMLNPDDTDRAKKDAGPSQHPPPPTFPPPPPPPPIYPVSSLPEDEFLMVKSNLRHVDNYTANKEVQHIQ